MSGRTYAEAVAEEKKSTSRLHTIIYNLTDEIKARHDGPARARIQRVYQGKAEVARYVPHQQGGHVAGCFVAGRAAETRQRDPVVAAIKVWCTPESRFARRFKDDVSEVRSGMECGVTIENYGACKPGDIIGSICYGEGSAGIFAEGARESHMASIGC